MTHDRWGDLVDDGPPRPAAAVAPGDFLAGTGAFHLEQVEEFLARQFEPAVAQVFRWDEQVVQDRPF